MKCFSTLRALALAVVFLTGSAHAALQVTVAENSSSIGRFDIYELTLTHATSYPNNWEDVVVNAQFKSPSNQTAAVGGFYYDTNTWKLRFAPRELGTYSWTLTFVSPNGSFSSVGGFSCVASQQSGFVRINPSNRYQLCTEGDGKFFYPIGFNDLPGDYTPQDGKLDWCLGLDPQPITTSSDVYFGTYAQQGKNNFFRWNGQGNLQLWMTGQVNVNGTGKNVYDKAHGKLGDEMAQKLHQYGMKYQLAFLASPTLLLPNWDMTNAARWASLKSLHRYVINRWGAYTDIWELMNEGAGVPTAYYDAITQYIWSLDPYHHLITTSYVPAAPHPNLEVISPHNYLNVDNLTMDKGLASYIRGLKPKYPNSPMVMGEIGNQSPILNYDPERYRIYLWLSFATEASPIFWNTSYAKNGYTNGLTNMYIGNEERALSTIFANFVSSFDPLARPLSVTCPTTVRAYAIGSSHDVAVYVLQAASHTTTLSTATITLTVPQSGMQGTWINPKTGAILQTFSPASGNQTLPVPSFTADIVLRLKAGGSPPPPIPGTLSFSTASYVVGEGTATATVTVTRTGGSSGAVAVSYATSNGTALAGSDYTAASGTLSWAAGDVAAKTFTVAITNDTAVESSETINLTLSNPTGGATLGTQAIGVLTITDNDVAPAIGALAFGAANYSVGEGTATATITVTRTSGSSGAVSVTYATSNGTALAGSDYTAASGTLSWVSGDAAAKTFTVAITNDTAVESSETISLTLSNPTGGATLGTQATAVLTITDNDVANAPPVITSPATATPNPAQVAQSVIFSVGASDPDGDTLTLAWSYGDGTSGVGASTTHAFGAAGTYNATVTVSDGKGGSVSSSISVSVTSSSQLPQRLAVYSSAGDGRASYWGPTGSGGGQTQWDQAHDALSGDANYTAATRSAWAGSGYLGYNAINICRGFLAFDTSVLPDNAVISSASVHIFVKAKRNAINDGNDFLSVVQGFQASTSVLSGSDYSKAGDAINNPTEGSARVDIGAVVVNAYNQFPLNNAGCSWISATGFTKLAVREGHDLLDIWPNYQVQTGNGIDVAMSETVGTTSDPYLEIFYTVPPSGASSAVFEAAALPASDESSLKITQLSGSAKFEAPGRDTCAISGLIAGAALPASSAASLFVNGVELSFALDAKGRGKSPQGTIRFLQLRSGNGLAFNAVLKKGAWAEAWNFDSTIEQTQAVSELSIQLNFSGESHSTQARVTGSSSARAGAKFKFSPVRSEKGGV